jgi:hypothetical protein
VNRTATPLRVVHMEGLMDIEVAMVKQAFWDYSHKPSPKLYASAKAFLTAAGLLLPDGSVDYHGHKPHIRKGMK